jgi:murein DD-endopeptidase MepM/ murein hydrolase activator NlpD
MWLLFVVLSLLAPAGLGAASGCLLPPVQAPVLDPFRRPACEWCPGNRGLQFGGGAGMSVRVAAAGTVRFSGVVAGTRYVVIEHALGGLRATYGSLVGTALRVGDVVAAGSTVGQTTGTGLYFGLRRGDTYIDPAPLLGRLVERPRLVPTDGTRPRPAPPPTVRCAAADVGRP